MAKAKKPFSITDIFPSVAVRVYCSHVVTAAFLDHNKVQKTDLKPLRLVKSEPPSFGQVRFFGQQEKVWANPGSKDVSMFFYCYFEEINSLYFILTKILSIESKQKENWKLGCL